MIGSDTFIIVALRWTENRTPCSLASATCARRNASRAARRITAASSTSPASTGVSLLQHRGLAVGGDVLDAHAALVGHRHRLLGRAEVAVAHRRDVRPRVAAPRAHRVRVPLRVGLHRRRRAAVGVALAQDRVDRRALDLVVAGPDVALLVGAGVLGVGRQVVALLAQLGDRGLELRHRCADVGQLDDVGLGRGGQLAQLGQRVGNLLLGLQPVRELGQDAAGQRDVAQLELDPGRGGERLDDRQQREGGQRGRLVGLGVDDLGHTGRPSSRLEISWHQDIASRRHTEGPAQPGPRAATWPGGPVAPRPASGERPTCVEAGSGWRPDRRLFPVIPA